MDELLIREEILWKQRSRLDKIKGGDRNTKYFQRKASQRAIFFLFWALRKDDGCLTENLEEMKGITNSFFKQLYSCDASVDPSHIISLFKPRVTDDMNDDLCKPFTEKEISDALFQMGPLKAPGPDGFPARFFQRNWGLIKDDIVKAVQQFFYFWNYA